MGDSTTTDLFTYSANGLIGTASNATESVRMVSVPSARLDTVQTTILASGAAEHTYTVVHYRSNDAGGTDSTTISSDGAPAQLVTRRYVSDSTNGTLKAINLGSTLGQGTFTSDVAGWRTATAWPAALGGSGADRTSVFLSTGIHAYETYGYLPFYAGYRVDSAGRILRDHRPDGGSSYTNRIFGYDELGRYTGTTSVSESQYPWACGGSGSFDPNYGRVGCAIDSVYKPYVYAYDGVGNRVGTGITNSGVGDQISTSDGFSYTYDDDGNVATRSQSGTVWTYRWSSDNRLRGASTSSYGTLDKRVSFDYGPLGSPVVKRDSSGSTGWVTRVAHVTLYDGSSILADLDSAGNRIAEYVYDEGTDRPYAMLLGSTTVTGVRYYAQDDMGNVQGLFSNATHVTEKVTYGDWGLPSITGDTTNRLTWKGLSYDRDVGLTYMRSRWYDPNIGRFVSEDPLGLGGGINPYVFANNDPINGSDPSGMSAANGCTLVGYQYNYVNSGNGPILDSVTPEYDCSSGGGNGTLPPMAPADGVSTVHGGGGTGTQSQPTSLKKADHPSCTAARANLSHLGQRFSDFGTTTTRTGIGAVTVSGIGAMFAPEAIPVEAGGAEFGVSLIEIGNASSSLGATLEGYGRGGITGAAVGFVANYAIDRISDRATKISFVGSEASTRHAFAALLAGVPDALHQAEVACGSP